MLVLFRTVVTAGRRNASRVRRRSAFTLLELIVTCVLLGILFTVMVPLLASTARQRQASDRRLVALTHAANVLERWTAREYVDLAAGATESVPLPEDVLHLLPQGQAEVAVADEPDGPPARRIAVTIRWQDRHGPARPVRLTGWVFRAGASP